MGVSNTMKARVKSTNKSSPTKKEAPSFHRYLKPGALAQIRDSKFTAKSRKPNSLTLVALQVTNPSSTSTISESLPAQNPMDHVPSFASRITHPRCIQRKKLAAIAPTFSDIQSA